MFKPVVVLRLSELVLQSAYKTDGGYADSSDDKYVRVVDNEIDIDLADPEVEKAATKIQAGFKGLKTRKELRSVKV